MSEKGFKADWVIKKKTAMGQQVGGLKDFKDMSDTALIHVEERELLAWSSCYPMICPKDKKFNKFLQEIAIPILKRVGRARWYRDIITDLSLALSSSRKGDEREDVANLLEDEEE